MLPSAGHPVSRLRFSIITPSFNQARYIGRTIDSVLGQRGDFDLDYVVLDGGSTDGTMDVLRGHGDRLRWVSAKDDGQVAAVNQGLRAAAGDVVGFLNSDDTLLPGALARVADAFAVNPRVEWVHGRCVIIDEEDREVRKWVSAYKHVQARRHSFRRLLTENYISQMTAFWRRGVMTEIGYLDPELPLAFDYDLWLRLARRGPPVYVEEPIACFRWYASSKSGANFPDQLREGAAITDRYAGGMRWPRLHRRAKNVAITAAYSLMALAQRKAGE